MWSPRGLEVIKLKLGSKIVFISSSNNLQTVLGNPKDKTPTLGKSGFYESEKTKQFQS